MLYNPILSPISTYEFWSEPLANVTVTSEPTTIDGSDIVINLPIPLQVIYARRLLRVGRLENTHVGANYLDGGTVALTSQVIQIQNGGDYIDAIVLSDRQFEVKAANDNSSQFIYGNVDVCSVVKGNGTYHTRWLLAKALADSLVLHDLQMGLQVYFRQL